ncbi:MAG: AAA family ATPase, partial [Chloroflexota bacterium]
MAEIRKATPRIGRLDRYLSEDGSNLAVVLYNLQRKDRLFRERISQAMRGILPATQSVESIVFSPNSFSIEWFWEGVPEAFFIDDLSDGTIRMLCWASILLSPQLPTLIVIEEPEMGIHVSWLSTLAAWIKSAAKKTQVIVTTHSPTLLDQFTDQPENVLVFHPILNDKVHFSVSPLNKERLQSWIDDGWELGDLYRIGDPVIGGWPW